MSLGESFKNYIKRIEDGLIFTQKEVESLKAMIKELEAKIEKLEKELEEEI